MKEFLVSGCYQSKLHTRTGVGQGPYSHGKISIPWVYIVHNDIQEVCVTIVCRTIVARLVTALVLPFAGV